MRSEPAVRTRVEGSLSQCVEAIATTIAADTGVPREEAELLSVGLAGLAETAARWWLGSRGVPGSLATPAPARSISKERAVELMVDLAWRGLIGWPLLLVALLLVVSGGIRRGQQRRSTHRI